MSSETKTTLMGCGTSILGQLGQVGDSPAPTPIAAKGVVHIEASGWTSFLIHDNGQASFLGCNKDGQIPHAQTAIINTPLSPSQIKKVPKDSICCADYFTAVLSQEGSLSIFGKFNLPDQLKDKKFSSIFAKFNWLAGITKENELYCIFNELDSEGKQQFSTYSRITLVNSEITPTNINTITSFSESQIAILTDAGSLYVFPKSQSNNEKTIELQPKFPDFKIVSVASTRSKAIILISDGRIYEVVNTSLVLVSGYNGLAISLFGGGASLGLITYEGDCYMWGCGTHGQLGNGSFSNFATPRKVDFDDSCVIEAAAGEEHTLFLTSKPNAYSVLLPKLMKNQYVPYSISMMGTIPDGFKPPEFDVKF